MESVYGASEKHLSYGPPPKDFCISREHVKPPPPGHDPECALRRACVWSAGGLLMLLNSVDSFSVFSCCSTFSGFDFYRA